MRHYIWFHPSYMQEEDESVIIGQKKNAEAHGYTLLKDSDLTKVNSGDHLTIVGHSTPPQNDEKEVNDTGLYIQGENAAELIKHLKQSGLRYAPKILTLESCRAGITGGIAQEISNTPFFKYTVVEANTEAVGRNYGVKWTVATDSLGRAIIDQRKSRWVFYLQGYEVQRYSHADYDLEQLLSQITPKQFQQRFFSNYHPGCLGGRVGRYCSKGNQLTLGQALFFAQENTNSATADALDLTLNELYGHKPYE